MKTPAQARSRRTLSRIIAAAVHSFAEVGVDHATVAEIVRDAKSSVGSFYGRFSSKDELVTAVDELLWGEVDERWRSSLYELAGVAGGGADPLSDSVTELHLSVAASGGPSMLALSRAVFGAFSPALVARSRSSDYLQRNGHPSQREQVLARMRADVLRTLSGTGSIGTGMSLFLTDLVLRAATDPDMGADASDHFGHVLAATLGRRAVPESGGIAESPVRASAGSMPTPPSAVEPDPVAPPQEPEPEPPKPEAFDIWA